MKVNGSPRAVLWTAGAVYGTIGIFLAIFDHPLVPLTYVLHIPAIAVGGAVGTAVLREKYGPRAVIAYYAIAIWLIYASIVNQTSISPIVIFTGLFSLVRASVQWVAENGA